MHIRTGRGVVTYREEKNRGYVALRNFDIDNAWLKPEHKEAIRQAVVPVLNGGGSVSLVGTADRSGPRGHNYTLSIFRVDNVLSFLQQETQRDFKTTKLMAHGEDLARREGMRDHLSDDYYRAVTIVVWPDPKPKPVKAEDIVLPPVPGVLFFTKWGWTYDVVAGIADGAAAFSTVFLGPTAALLLELTAGVLGALGPIIAGPVAFAEADRTAEFNGTCEGYWQAMQAMADQYRNNMLDRTPYEKWPALQPPVLPPNTDVLNTRFHQLKQRGRKKGATMAFESMQNLEQQPLTITIDDQGQKRRQKIRGRMMLRGLRIAHGSGVGEWVQGLVNTQLQKQGLGTWPIGLSNKI